VLFFTSDTHFGHQRILPLQSRPFATMAAMHEALITRWNAVVSPKDTVIHLGDFGLGTFEEMRQIFRQLQGHKHLVIGNHDKGAVLKQSWKSRHGYLVQKWQGLRFVCCHFPLATWWHAYYPHVLHVHGHTHGGVVPAIPHRFDVGSDAEDFTPVSAEVLFARSWMDPHYDGTQHLHQGRTLRTS
jgi:calcineurin-like phosphoesterase family protein